MGKFIDYTGQKFGRLTVVERIGTKERGTKHKIKTPLWLCKCECGNEKIVTSAELRTGDVKSCGCLQLELISELSKTHGDATKNSKYYRLYKIWTHMLNRCEKPSDKAYPNYGGRGISVCAEWHDYQTFKTWSVDNGYSDELSIDRIDNNGDYTSSNCRWTDFYTQANNRRSCRYVTINNKTKTITEWCRIYGISPFTVYSRIDRFNWSPVKAIILPPARKHFYDNCTEENV